MFIVRVIFSLPFSAYRNWKQLKIINVALRESSDNVSQQNASHHKKEIFFPNTYIEQKQVWGHNREMFVMDFYSFWALR